MINRTIVIARSPAGRGWRLEAAQTLPRSRHRLFEFFSDAFQLESLTPPWLHFAVITPPPIRIAEGAVIDYRLRVRGIPLRWRSVITAWEPPSRFVDEQVRGPYRRWRHEHILEQVGEATLCRDVVDYEAPGGRVVNALLIAPDLRRIFAYRQRRLAELFRPDAAP